MIPTRDPSTQEELKKVFTQFDADKDGSLNIDDLRKVMHFFGRNAGDSELNDIISEAGSNGAISQAQFLQLFSAARESEDELKEAFNMFDTDGDKLLNKVDFTKVLASLGHKATPEEIQEMIDEADVDGDGMINYEEFVKMVVTM
ncbi:hypothetical protein BB558_006748 [Smittium angustum]|uniref:EF-hand domain-containing protein n=1 Tax=Smittium angustum TaxID=133377 RepID=A0A2U1IWR5_SMIAN|nr:hypothetical protein BB558_006825 [Smittium angustum]PVZ97291.1 hypothetical protein BB558_006748 [Smittium angustum]